MTEEFAQRQTLECGDADWILHATSPTSPVVDGLEGAIAFASDGGISVLFDGILHEPAPSRPSRHGRPSEFWLNTSAPAARPSNRSEAPSRSWCSMPATMRSWRCEITWAPSRFSGPPAPRAV